VARATGGFRASELLYSGERRGFDGPRHWRITYPAAMTRDAIMAELLEIEGLLQGDRLNDDDRHALHGAQQALRNILDPETWHQASQTFYRIDNKPSEADSLLLH
jgi:hypothetical protein